MNPNETVIEIRNLPYRPLTAEQNVLSIISLDIRQGDFALQPGPSGYSRSALARFLNGLVPHLDQGEMTGAVVLTGLNTVEHEIHEFATIIGMVFQNPDDQIISLTEQTHVPAALCHLSSTGPNDGLGGRSRWVWRRALERFLPAVSVEKYRLDHPGCAAGAGCGLVLSPFRAWCWGSDDGLDPLAHQPDRRGGA